MVSNVKDVPNTPVLLLVEHRDEVYVSRRPAQCEFYAFPLERRLPRAAIPLAHDDPDVVLDLQAAFARCWEAGPYPELLRYENPAPGDLETDQSTWCRQRLAEAKLIEA